MKIEVAEHIASLKPYVPGKPLEELERDHIRRVLEATRGVIAGEAGAARVRGLHRSTLRSRMIKLALLEPSKRH